MIIYTIKKLQDYLRSNNGKVNVNLNNSKADHKIWKNFIVFYNTYDLSPGKWNLRYNIGNVTSKLPHELLIDLRLVISENYDILWKI